MYKFKLKEIEVGDVGVRGGVKSTVTDIDPHTGGITWDITDVAAFDTVYKTFNKLKKFLKKLEATGEAKKDLVLDEISDKVEDLFSDYWTHIRSTYPEAYAKIKLTKESVNETATDRFLQSSARNLAKQMRGKSASRDTLMNRLNSMPLASRLKPDELEKIVDYAMQEMGLIDEGEGESYLTPKAFDKNKKSTGANDIYYYKLGYKPVPKKIKGSGLEVKQLFEKEELTEYSDFQQKRIQHFSDIEVKLNQISPLLSNAKNETSEYYNENPGSYEVVYSTDMVGSLIDDITELLKQEE
tara:strand:- start:584 stop:1477 length:894 start_codon:yes stop_codon:yes gene_type:complete